MSTQDMAAVVTALATLVNVAVTIYLAYATKRTAEAAKATVENANEQLTWTKGNSRGDFLLRLDEAFLKRENVRAKLAPGGDWHRKKADPNFPKGPNLDFPGDLTAVTSYLGIFERIKALKDEKLITIDAIDDWYGDRIFNIVINKHIEKRLLEHKPGWSNFINLWSTLEARRKKSGRWLPSDRPDPDDEHFAHLDVQR